MDEIQNKEELTLLGEWFKRDDNSVPPEYILQVRINRVIGQSGEAIDSPTV